MNGRCLTYTCEDFMLNKYLTGNYLLLVKDLEMNKWELISKPIHIDRSWWCKLIHKRHKGVLLSYLENINIKIYYTSLDKGMAGEINGDFINYYDEKLEYYIKT